MMSIAKILGKGKEYDELLRKRFEIDSALEPLEKTIEMLAGVEREIAACRENHPELPNRRVELADRIGKREAYLDLLERKLDLEGDLLCRYRTGIWKREDL